MLKIPHLDYFNEQITSLKKLPHGWAKERRLIPNWSKIAWRIAGQRPNTHNFRQYHVWDQNLEMLRSRLFWTTSNLVERIHSHKYLPTMNLIKTICAFGFRSKKGGILLNPRQHKIATAVEARYKRRFPNTLTKIKKQQLPTMLIKLSVVAVKCASNGMPYALTICIIYGRITATAQNSMNMLKLLAKMNGFSVRFRRNSLILSENFALTWPHRTGCSAQNSHAVCTDAMWFSSRANSSCTPSADIQPRSHCNDFWAALGRFFDSNQFGDSGI